MFGNIHGQLYSPAEQIADVQLFMLVFDYISASELGPPRRGGVWGAHMIGLRDRLVHQ